jgi:hypothetical protein
MAVLDTPPEEGFDALTRLAANVCSTPIAIVSLIDGDRLVVQVGVRPVRHHDRQRSRSAAKPPMRRGCSMCRMRDAIPGSWPTTW